MESSLWHTRRILLVKVLRKYPFTSKLFINVREKLSLCYYCSMVSHYVKGLFIITAGINACDKEKAQEAILKQLDDMKKGDFSALRAAIYKTV